MRSRPRHRACLVLVLGLGTLIAYDPASAQRAQGPPPGPREDLLELALDSSEAIGLTPEQRSRLEQFQAQSIDRTAAARALVEARRAELDARRDSLRALEGRPRGRAGGRIPGRELSDEEREALQLLREERRARFEELQATVTAQQMETIRDLARRRRSGVAGDRPRFRGRQDFRGRFQFRGAPGFRDRLRFQSRPGLRVRPGPRGLRPVGPIARAPLGRVAPGRRRAARARARRDLRPSFTPRNTRRFGSFRGGFPRRAFP